MADQLQEKVISILSPLVEREGYELVHVEVQSQRGRVLRVYIDRPETGVGIEDCVKVTKALDEPLEQSGEIETIFKGPYELEVSSPGVDRPLRTQRDFERFAGREARIHTFRPLTAEEIGNAGYHARNPKQKNFVGRLLGLNAAAIPGPCVKIDVSPQGHGKPAKKGMAKAKPTTNSAEAWEVLIPLPLISKANIEPNFDFVSKESTEK